jgi:ferritin-like metal-binding protein YciE
MATATTNEPLTQKLISYLQATHAMETDVKLMLGSMILTTKDPAIRTRLEEHKRETEVQMNRLEERLQALDSNVSLRKETSSIFGALGKGMLDAIRTDKAGKNIRDGYVTEHLEIASYQLLKRLAAEAGDTATVAIAEQNLAEEEAMARFFNDHWDDAVTLTLEENGLT